MASLRSKRDEPSPRHTSACIKQELSTFLGSGKGLSQDLDSVDVSTLVCIQASTREIVAVGGTYNWPLTLDVRY